MSSTFVATCRSSNCRIAFDDVIVYYLLQRDDLNKEYYRQTEIKNWRLHSPLSSISVLQLGKTSYITLQVYKATLLTAVLTIHRFQAFSSNMLHKFRG
jgi:hypothetical protein